LFRSRIFARPILAVLLVSFSAPSAYGHGPIPEQIAGITRRIEQDPKNARLYLRRGELYRVHRAWSPALADYGRAMTLDAELDVVDLCRGTMFLEAGWPASAKLALDRFLEHHPDHPHGRITRARALVRLRRHAEAVADYTRAITALNRDAQSDPAHYLERARAQIAQGNDHEPAALAGLDEGIARLGPLVILELLAIDLELELRQYDNALARLERIAAQSPRKDKWLVRRGEILELAERIDLALETYAEAIEQIRSLPASRRNAPATRQRRKQLETAIARLTTEIRTRATRTAARPEDEREKGTQR
jgi:tetratricopeptide (TPR) repeat protein